MNQHRLEVADVFRHYRAAYLEAVGDCISPQQRQALRAITHCRTAALGGHVQRCDRCGHQRIWYNSCRNRHCPKCQATARAEWLRERAAELLPVEYFHVVFTLPRDVGPLALQNQRVVYGLLFRAAAETLLEIAADPRHLGAEIGFLAVLHTWGQNLLHHPHVHCVVPGGGLARDGSRWVGCRPGFFLPVRVLSRVFRGKFLELLGQAFGRGELVFHGALRELDAPHAFRRWLRSVKNTDWVVYAKPPFGGPGQVLKYLARYTHRVAISNRRLVDWRDGQVTFRWKDYAAGKAPKNMTLDALEFIRRFLLHVLPRGFMRIRHYGLLANRHRHQKLRACRALLKAASVTELTRGHELAEPPSREGQDAPQELCPVCQKGHMVTVEELRPDRHLPGPAPCLAAPHTFDTS